ncbi:MAG: hypothetical protein AB8I08_33510 [Sandaracinaceae bacterium]
MVASVEIPKPSVSPELTVLLVAEGEPLAAAIEERLLARGLQLETATAETASSVAYVVAPDLVVVAGHLSHDPDGLLASFASRSATSTLPVVIVADPHGESVERPVFRHGVVARIDRSASADEMARQIQRLAEELPEREGTAEGDLDAADINEVLGLLTESLRSGVLSVESGAGPQAQVLVHAERPLRETLLELVSRLRGLVEKDAGPLRYRFDEAPTARISSLDVFGNEHVDRPDLAGRRVLLAERDPARADVLAQTLRAIGVQVAVVDGTGARLELARELMPEVLLIDDRGVEGWASGLLRAVRHDPWLRWASLLIVDAARLWADPRRPDVDMLAPRVQGLVATDEELSRRVREEPSLQVRLDLVGPVRLLRLLGRAERGIRLEVTHPRMRIEIDIAEGLVAGAAGFVQGSQAPVVHGTAALATLMGLHSGRVRITHVEAPRSANLMSPIDDALIAATTETPAIAPSLPPPSLRPSRPPEARADAGDLPRALDRLEALLTSLVPPPPAPSAADGGGPRENEFPLYAEDADDEGTGQYGPELVERLRRRMKNSDRSMASGPPPQPERPPAPPQTSDHAGESAQPRVAPRPTGARRKGIPPPRASLDVPRPKSIPAPPSARPKPLVRPSSRPARSKPSAPPPPGRPALRSGKGKPSVAPPTATLPQPPRRKRRRDRTLMLGSAMRPAPSSAEASSERPSADPSPHTAQLSQFVPRDTPPGQEQARTNEPLAQVEGTEQPTLEPVQDAPSAPPSEEPPLDLLAGVPSVDAVPDATPFAPVEVAPRRTWLPLVLGAGLGGLLLVGGGAAFWVFRGASPEAHESPSVADAVEELPPASDSARGESTDPVAEPLEVEPLDEAAEAEPVAEAAPVGEAEPVAEAAPVAGGGAEVGPSADEPIEGTDAEWDPEAFGIEPVDVPSTRRAAGRMRDRLIREANRLRREGELEAAQRAYTRFAGAFPNDPRGMAGLARVHMQRGDAANGIVFAQRLTRIRPRFASNFLLLGDVLLAAGNAHAARRAFQRAARMEPRWAPARQRLATMDE